uniref:F-box protein AT5G49610-like beta-propeller domain-containing protein n=1 Tax=Setaria viridis TaxID=4556 RepID=A0A4U6SZC4_SETVI|nr:uncharacterized protein LOC117840838 [Setaria viridis]TKV94469.1 hypothetical protein SEVIR_9G297200v2 [Setaria viridis]
MSRRPSCQPTRRLRSKQPPATERPPSSSRSQRFRVTIEDDDGGETNGSAALVSPLENDDLIADSLLLLPALPSSLLHASLVCKRWFRVLSNPRFLHEFCAHHRKPPLLGLFYCNWGRIIFTPMLDPPDEIPVRRFALEVPIGTNLLCCHHGRVLMHDVGKQYFMVWEPITGKLCRISKPSSFSPYQMTLTAAAIVCASTDRGHIHGACHSDPFQVVVVAGDSERFYGCVYSSETRAWGNLFWILRPPQIRTTRATYGSQLFRNSICLLLIEEKIAILEFDWSRQNLVIIDVPYALDFYDFFTARSQFLIKLSDGGGLSFVAQKVFTVHVWKRTSDGDGVATWMLVNTIDLSSVLSLGLPEDLWMHLVILASDGDGNVLFRKTSSRVVYVVNLESRKVKKLPKTYPFKVGHPFSSFYTPGMHLNTGHDNEVQKISGA